MVPADQAPASPSGGRTRGGRPSLGATTCRSQGRRLNGPGDPRSEGLPAGLGGGMTIVVRRYRGGETARRAVDVALAGAAALVTSPVALVAAFLVRATMGSPVLFRQAR